MNVVAPSLVPVALLPLVPAAHADDYSPSTRAVFIMALADIVIDHCQTLNVNAAAFYQALVASVATFEDIADD